MEQTTKKDLTGMKFNRLQVLERTTKDGRGGAYWLCKCDCNGDNSLKKVRQDGLLKGTIKSCGCLNYENITKKRNTNQYVHMEDYTIIKTYNTKGEHLVYIDNEDFDKVKKYTWTHVPLGYIRTTEIRNGVAKRILIHRLILDMLDSGSKIYIDHIDGNPSNNRKYNLRMASNMENQRNAKISTMNSSGYRGVTFRPKTNTWRATISLDKQNVYLGEYRTKEEAIIVRKDAELKHYGDYSMLNREKVIRENIDRIELDKINQINTYQLI